ncbi:hemolysin III family protein [Endozoicomonas sp. G2_1]|uniref:PAQR family membrane homeostasis protein TrhA n=1 Tax=Endozoicomonas sp. G2_1 TaxID=2821091 RepID=UPI001ADA1AEC|nr:hemolysin III family protein [Endozoicomonas sp. G2_1]MBO9490194.1 hemolysin III family protein [Endozoicomonas sp. G2_1]
MSATIPAYSPAEELANAISHGIGAILSVVGLICLLGLAIASQDLVRITSFAIYGASLVLLFLASTLYHAIVNQKVKQLFKLLDHCAIYLLIAGTYTPLMLITLEGTVGYIMLSVIWLIAIAGITFKIKCGSKYPIISVSTYLGMGFLSIAVIQQLYINLSTAGLTLLAVGGAIYALGVIFYIQKKVPFSHAIWHLFVLAGAACHFFMIWYHV